MFINIDPSSGLPIYLQIAQQIKTAVAMGRLHPEDPLPSVRQLAVDLAVNPNTVARAYRELEVFGVVTKRRATGTYVSAAGSPLARQTQLRILADRVQHLPFTLFDLLHREIRLHDDFTRQLEHRFEVFREARATDGEHVTVRAHCERYAAIVECFRDFVSRVRPCTPVEKP